MAPRACALNFQKNMKKNLIYALAVAAVIALPSCGNAQKENEKVNEAVADAQASELRTVTGELPGATDEAAGEAVKVCADDNQYRPDGKVEKLTIIDFSATWCGPCKIFAPVFDEAAGQFAGKVDFVSVDIDKCPETAAAFSVEAVPTVVLLRPDGKTVRYVGTQDILPLDKFVKVVTENL